MTQLDIQGAEESWSLSGDLTYETVQTHWQRGIELLEPVVAQTITLDVGGLAKIDSAGVAALVNLVSLVKARGKSLRFSHIPTRMQAIIKVSALSDILLEV